MMACKIERDYLRLCAAAGFPVHRVERRSRHYALHFAAGFVIAPCTPSDRRTLLNLRAEVRRLHH